jgi:hypothetical protein
VRLGSSPKGADSIFTSPEIPFLKGARARLNTVNILAFIYRFSDNYFQSEEPRFCPESSINLGRLIVRSPESKIYIHYSFSFKYFHNHVGAIPCGCPCACEIIFLNIYMLLNKSFLTFLTTKKIRILMVISCQLSVVSDGF